jgi:NAD(P)-dependent dehydrogenase (short-subunit alcohol dehydrogenase family)
MQPLIVPEPEENALVGRAFLITGACGTLGRVAAQACALAGGKVILLDKDVAGLEALRDEILTQLPAAELALFPMDLAGAMPEHYLKLAETLKSYTSALHGIVHHAVHLEFLEPLACLPPQRWFRSLQVNLHAPYLLTWALFPLLKASEDAVVIFTSDSAARQANAYWGAYGVSKVGLEALARILAEEWESSSLLRVHVLVPGAIASPIRRLAFPGAEESLTPPQSLAKLYVYLLGPASRGESGYTYFHQGEGDVLRSR